MQRKDKKPKRPKGFFLDKDLQSQFLQAYFNNKFNLTKACEEVDISRYSYYWAIDHDDDFAAMVDMSERVLKNVMQSSLVEGIVQDDLVLRQKFLSLLPSNVLARMLNNFDSELDTNGLIFKLNKDDFLDGKE